MLGPNTYPNVLAVPPIDGVKYAVNVPLTSTEADIYNQLIAHPVPVLYNQSAEAIVTFTAQGALASDTAYVVMQTDMGDNNWVDVAGCVWNGVTGQAAFTLSSVVAGALAIQQTRAAGTPPAGNFANAMMLGGRIRFVGKATTGTGSSSSSSSSGAVFPQILATVVYRMLGLR